MCTEADRDKPVHIKIMDFGFAHFYKEQEEKMNLWPGTPAYVAPELYLKDKDYGFGVDVWAVGVTTYTMLARQFPFQKAGTEKDNRVAVC
jgi:serine/threonine protein kinase